MIFPKPSWRSGTSLFELFAFILVRIHKDTKPPTNFADYMQAWSRINATIAPYFPNLLNLLYNKQYTKLTSARHFVIGRPIRLDASGLFPEILRKTSEGKKEYYGTYKRTNALHNPIWRPWGRKSWSSYPSFRRLNTPLQIGIFMPVAIDNLVSCFSFTISLF